MRTQRKETNRTETIKPCSYEFACMEAAVVANVFVAASTKILYSLLNEKTERFRAVEYHLHHYCTRYEATVSMELATWTRNSDAQLYDCI